MRRLIGLAMMADGVLQALGVAGLLYSFPDRYLGDQALIGAHVLAGAGLVFAGRQALTGDTRVAVPAVVLIGSLLLSVLETAWFNWPGTAVRVLYTVVALVVVTRKTTLPTT